MKYLKNEKFLKYCRYIPIVITLAMIISCAVFAINHDIKDILDYTPDDLVLAAVVIIGFFGLKSLSVVLPLAALFMTSGKLYPLYISIPLNIVGLAVCFTVPYLVGRFAGSDLLDLVIEKFPKARRFVDYSHNNDLFASYITRAVVVVPGDIASIVFGTLRMPYRPYLIGSIMGVLPEMIVETYIGRKLGSMTVGTVIAMIIMIAATLLFSFLLNKKVSKKGKEYDDKDF